MKLKNILFLILVLSIIASLNFTFASDLNETSLEQISSDDNQLNSEFDSLNVYESSESENNVLTSDSKIIYVGHHNKTEGGIGSYDNPFTNFKAACDEVNGEERIIINVFDGEYYLGEGLGQDSNVPLLFNTNNLNIIGVNGSVIIKNLYNDNDNGLNKEAFQVASKLANVSFSNIVFDATNCDVFPYLSGDEGNYFSPFAGNANNIIFDNCSFIGFKGGNLILGTFNTTFFQCSFDVNGYPFFYQEQLAGIPINTPIKFEYCTINYCANPSALCMIKLPSKISIENVWFGQNSLPDYIGPFSAFVANPDGTWNNTWKIPVNRYAQMLKQHFIINYLGNNQYEIIGKLTWNGTENQDGMENFQPMTVNLVSTTGDINQTATLVNGNFRTIYTSSNPTHKVTATLHNEEIELEFTTVNITSNPASIYYGDDQNITFNFTQPITANVTVTVSNGSYNKSEKVEVIGKDSLVYTVPDTLKAGTYDVEINLAENNLFGFSTTTLTVSKVSDYTFEVATGDVKFGENATISITLPKDVNGTVIVKFGNDTKELPANQTMTVNFTNLNATTYSVNVSYSGNDKYVTKDYPTAFVTVDPADSGLEIEDATFTYADVIAIPFNVTNAEGVNVIVYNKNNDEVATDSSESGTINLDTLPAGKYSLDVETIVGPNYASILKKIDLTINKANSSIDIQDKEFAYAAEAVINAVTINSTGDVIATLTDVNNSEIEVTVSGNSITLPKLNVGKYTLTVTTNPDENHNNVTKTATITINKATHSMNVIIEPVENITTKDDVTLTISLPSDATGEVTVKINGKKTEIKSANETITINLNNQAGDYVVDVTYSGDKNYESDMATQEYTVSKAETSITAKQIDFEEGNASKIEVTVPDVESGIVLVDVAGKKFYGDIESGKSTITLEGVPEGNYTANIKFFGDDKYKEATTTTDVKVSEDKIITELKEQLEEAQGNATQLFNNLTDANKKVDDLTAQLNESQANASKLAEDLVDANGKVDDLTAQLNESQANASKLAEDLDDLTAQLNESQANASKLAEDLVDANAKVDDLTGELANATDKIADLNGDLADANAKVDDLVAELNETQANATKLSEDLVAANQTIDDLLKQLEEAKANATNVTVPETVVVDGVEYPIEYVNGTATIETNKTEPVVLKSSEFGEITINDDQSISIVLKDGDGNVIADAPITYTINGAKQSTTTDKDGKFAVKGENGAVITINYAGNDNIAGTNTTLKLNNAAVPEVVKVAAQFNISDRAITLKGYAVDGPAGEQGIYYATTLLDTNGKPISNAYIEFAVNNKIYNRTTLENGSFNPYKLNMIRAGRYTMAFNFAGDDNYTNAFACVCVDLDKKPITIKAPAKTYKAATKTKKYTATLSTIPSVYDGKVYLSPKTVKLTVNGKTFTGQTNDKGQVTFKITNLNKKGKYTATISYKGDKTYEEATQKVKLTIK